MARIEDIKNRDFFNPKSFQTDTADLNQRPLGLQEQVFSKIPEDNTLADTRNKESILSWNNALWFPDDLGSERNAYYVKFEVFILDAGKNIGLVKGDIDKDLHFVQGGPRMAQNLEGENKLRNKQVAGSPVFKKLNEIIALPMPETVVTDHSTLWSRAEGGFISASVAMGDQFATGQASDAASKIAKSMALGVASGIASLLEQVDLEGANTNLRLLTKRASNPRNEFLFDGVNNRSFNFQWKLIPRTPSEAIRLRMILEKMKLYMYPELDQSTAGNFYLFPAMFDITFMHKGEENDWLYKTSTCALTNMIINYTGAGQWVATNYAGAPVAWEVTMQFTEAEFLHRGRFQSYTNKRGVAR